VSNHSSDRFSDRESSGRPTTTGGIKHGGALGLLLAAGRGSRFDPSGETSKLLHTLEGKAIIGHAVAKLLDVCGVVFAVVRPQSPELKFKLEQAGCHVIESADAHLGMGHSLAWGLTEAERIYRPDKVVVMLGDMPYVKSSTIQILINSIDGDVQAVAPEFSGKRGNPWVFGKRHFAALKGCSGDRGAAAVLDPKDVCLIKVDDPGVLRDIDSLEDLETATSSPRSTTEATVLPTDGRLPKTE
jgi:molybdenum cofactor cytidylyltransferase